MLECFLDWRVLHYEHDEFASDWHWDGESPTGPIVRLLARKPSRGWWTGTTINRWAEDAADVDFLRHDHVLDDADQMFGIALMRPGICWNSL